MKVVSTEALTKLIQLVKSAFIKTDDVVEVTEIETETPSEVELATVAISGDYDDLSNKPIIPTVNDATLTIQKNGSNVATFTANASSNVTANISVPNVTSTYTATGTDAVNGVAVSNAIATKQDNLVSGTNIKTINGNSLLGSGNITIETSSTPNVDDETISYNSSDALQAIAVKNVRDGSTLPIWHGTEYQWNHGDPTTWYYWQTAVQALWTSGGRLPGSNYSMIAFGDNHFVISDAYSSSYSSDYGQNWNSSSYLPATIYGLVHGNGVFIGIGGNKTIYSTDGGATWQQGGNLQDQFNQVRIAYGNNTFVAVTGNSNKTIYSTDNGATWQQGADLPDNGVWGNMAYGNGRFILLNRTNGYCLYSTDNGATWQQGGALPQNELWEIIVYGNDRFIATPLQSNKTIYSTDGGATWQQGGNLPQNTRWQMAYGDGKFVALESSYSHVSSSYVYTAYSEDGMSWAETTLQSSDYNAWNICFGDGKFVAIQFNSYGSASFSVQYDKCYTDTANPTTTSVVYSEPNVTSSYTISSVTSGAITLSNNNTYYYNQSGNAYTYDTVGNSHPEYLCFIDGVGVKIGNTTIATNTPITTTITSSSTDTKAPSAKAVYDEIGDVETALNTLNSGS